MPGPSGRAEQIRPFQAMDLLARAQAMQTAGRDVIQLQLGEPDFPTPPAIIAAAQRALARGETFYTGALGLPALREAIAGFYRQRHALEMTPGRIAVTPGASGALLLALAATLDVGDGVLLADPGYPCNRQFARLLGVVPQVVPVRASEDYQPSAAGLEAAAGPGTRAVLLASPANPTGTLVPWQTVREIHALCRAQGWWLIVDEIYHDLVFEPGHRSALHLGEDVLVINSFSKFFQMTGWRLGWLAAPESLMPVLDRLAQNLYLAAPTLAQHAALAAFEPETLALLDTRRDILRARRDVLIPALRRLGFGVAAEPLGGFYVYADILRWGMDSTRFCERLLVEAGVALTPGSDFGTLDAAHHVRFAYVREQSVLDEAVRRITAWLATLD
jgi:aspartate/methionine/tyrosine aminotransferase